MCPCESRAARRGPRPRDPGPRHEAEPGSSRARPDAGPGSGPRVVVAVFVVLTRATGAVIGVVASAAAALFFQVTVVSRRSNDLKEEKKYLTLLVILI